MKEMKLTYIKITKTKHKFFYENGSSYGEFYLDIIPDKDSMPMCGVAELSMKDPDYGRDLLDGLSEALVAYKI